MLFSRTNSRPACKSPRPHSSQANRFVPILESLEDRLAPNSSPLRPVITEPAADGVMVSAFDVHMVIGAFSDPDPGDTHTATDWEIWTTGASPQPVWQALDVMNPISRVHIHLGDGTFTGLLAGRRELGFNTDYRLQVRVRDSSGDAATAWSPLAFRTLHTAPETQPTPGVGTWAVRQTGYKVETVATGFQLPVNIAFVPNPGPHDNDPYFYVTELYGIVKVVTRNGTVRDYATGLLNFNPTGEFPGSGEQGVAGLVVDPASGDLFVTMVYDAGGPHYPKIERLHSNDGGLTMATRSVVLAMPGESSGPSHQISNISIGPDGKLYVHVGDGFDLATPQSLDSFRGKIIRLNLNGTAVPDNPFYNAADGITARDYIAGYGLRNPFGGAWRAADGRHYTVENGPSVDRLSQLVFGRNYLYDGSDASMRNFAIYNWEPAHAPVNLTFIQPQTFGGSRFPAAKQDHIFVSESGPTYASGPQTLGKRISEFVLDAGGTRLSGPTPLIEYNGSGKATVVGLTAGPDGLYFSDFYLDSGSNPTARGSNILRVKYVGTAAPSAPSSLTAQALSSTQINLTWTDNADNEDGFRIEQSVDGINFVQLASVAANVTSFSVLGLQSGTTYRYRVRAYNNDFGNSAYSSTASATTLGSITIPAAPTNVTASAGVFQVTLSWSVAIGATSYNVYRATSSGGQGTIAYQPGVTATTYVDNNVSAGTTYYYRITASNAAGESPRSLEALAAAQAPSTFDAKINFQPSGAPVPAGYAPDTGAVFGARGGGLTFGWNVDNSGGARDRDDPTSPDQRYDTLTHLADLVWEIAVPNGSYAVRLVAGDPSYVDSIYRINIEGVLALSGTPSAASRWLEANLTVSVTDGRLTIASGAGAVNVKLNFIEINSSSVNPRYLATGADSGGGPHVKVFDAATGALKYSFFAYGPAFTGGVRVAVGDVNGDGAPDIVTAAGPGGGPHVRVFEGRTGVPMSGPIGSFFAYAASFSGGVFVAVGDVNGDGRADVITAPGAGGNSLVRIFSGADGSLLREFTAYEAFAGAVSVAAGDLNGDGRADIVTAPGAGGGPRIRAFSGADGTVLRDFLAYNPAFTGGVFVALGDVNSDGRADIITGAGAGGGPHVRVFSGSNGTLLSEFYAYSASTSSGVRVAAVDRDGDGGAEIVTAPGSGVGPNVRVFNGLTTAVLADFFAYDPLFRGGVFVGAR